MSDMFQTRSAEYRAIIEEHLKSFYAQFDKEPQQLLFDAVQYSLLSGGKRLRPIFTLEFCRMCGEEWKLALPFASAVEMIQTYSLIHDDLPCMDDDDLRRGRPTNHKVYGEGMAVLSGDALLTDAFLMASTAKLRRPEDMAFAISTLAQNAGSLGMVGGQVLDICSEDRLLTEQEVLAIQSRKTGALIKAACILGVIAAGGSKDQLDAAGVFADTLGLAFQIRDDMLDVIGNEQELGKAVGTDAAKNTFVRLYGLEKCEELVQAYTNEALKALEAFPDHKFLHDLALQLTQRTV